MSELGIHQLLGAFRGQVNDVCTVQVFGASHRGAEVLIEVRDYGVRPVGQYEVEVQRRDDGRRSEARGRSLEEACAGIQWHELDVDVTGDIGLEAWSRGPSLR